MSLNKKRRSGAGHPVPGRISIGPGMMQTMTVQKFSRVFLLATTLVGGTVAVAHAEPGGCLKYGAVGAVGGHVANHHTVAGAVGGCAVGMYKRHEYRKGLREKAALYDKEHPADPKESLWQRYRNRKTDEQKATLYDAEHPPAPQAASAH
ncbi:hypothetical protein GHA01_00560 [Novacetimonas hansenii]|uniref:Glycine zipper 2TM domain-containing protein n=3 Tax=Acetobacteraceae TaxID=433 RepID=A0AAW5EX31_NOVHA|nr:hypothetical protein [Novacetimonas hansenii]MCJ8355392.1 hypothetical protein [Novacetimonas hansenii]WEQ58057.1 hypothetical protein LV563_09175 [Novacetimonas hansenii]CUW46016.1 hypothetical protein ATCC53582_00097 [Novacetimonas hansenii]GAN85024.1 hypothetical protein Gaha_0290_001 [Novacetimonas hansenii JCM 7643]GBQ53392.1 hypothetical protein AA0243_0316 [Novacetimonas hansenii NRIC 0243]